MHCRKPGTHSGSHCRMYVYWRLNKWNLYSLWVLSFCLPNAVTITNSCVHHVGWEEIWCVWQSTSGHGSQPVGVQGTRSAAGEVRFPPPSRGGSPTASLYYNGDSGEYHAERAYWTVNIFIVSGGGPLCACVGPLATRGNGNTGNLYIWKFVVARWFVGSHHRMMAALRFLE